jgi:hypothetical protein
MRLRVLLSVALVAIVPLKVLAAESAPPCESDVKLNHVVAINDYYPNACWGTLFSVEVEFTIGTKGRGQDATVLNLDSVPAERRSCVEELVAKFVANALAFDPREAPCRYRMRITYRRSGADAA